MHCPKIITTYDAPLMGNVYNSVGSHTLLFLEVSFTLTMFIERMVFHINTYDKMNGENNSLVIIPAAICNQNNIIR